MAITTKSAFNQFMKDVVNVDSIISSSARSSRDWLYSKLKEFPNSSDDFPLIYGEQNIAYGSFARKTKIKPLDDIDLISCMSAEGAYYFSNNSGSYTVVSKENTRLSKYCHTDSDQVNSIRILNRYIKELKTVPQYSKAEINRRYEAAVLNLSSYEWSFDVVPAFFTAEDLLGKTYYLMPDGNGHWKKTDPRKDRNRLSSINQNHNGNVLNVIRLVKYWNTYRLKVGVSSYLIETMVANFYNNTTQKAGSDVHLEFKRIMHNLMTSIYLDVQDPKEIDGNINGLSFDKKSRVSSQARNDYDNSALAISYENEGKQEASINQWTSILGNAFPAYG